MGYAVSFQPLIGGDLVGAQFGTDLVVEDLGRCSGEGSKSGLVTPSELLDQRLAETACTYGDLQSGEAVDVDVGYRGPDGPGHV